METKTKAETQFRQRSSSMVLFLATLLVLLLAGFLARDYLKRKSLIEGVTTSPQSGEPLPVTETPIGQEPSDQGYLLNGPTPNTLQQAPGSTQSGTPSSSLQNAPYQPGSLDGEFEGQ